VTDAPDPYKILQVDPEAEDEVIQAAYRRLAQKYHPDRQPDAEGVQRMVAINAAWELVRDPARRAAYDASRATATRSAAAGAGAAGAAPAAPGERAGPTTPPPATRTSPATGGTATGQGKPGSSATGANRPPETVSRDWTSGRSGTGGGYDAATMRRSEGHGAAGPPPGNPSGTVLKFGRYVGWSIGEIARTDLEYLEWLDRMAIGRAYRDEIDQVLRKAGRRRSSTAEAADRHGLFRRR
jgi:curved DNA-binding protein CbpA